MPYKLFFYSLCSCGGIQLGDSQAGNVLAVMGMEMTENAFVQLVTEKASTPVTSRSLFYIFYKEIYELLLRVVTTPLWFNLTRLHP